MHLVRSIKDFPFHLVADGSVATIGSFDGLHLGHQKLLQHVLDEAKSRGVPAIVMSFEPTPKEFFA
ncbi:MAG: bifunctional riboflavin kinase/FAD synthetase, partial [Gammaproteobacteria bacterium]